MRSNSLGGRQVNESTLDKVPRAGTADNTALLGGLAPGAFARANPAATVDVANGGAERTVLALAGLGRLVSTANGCDTTDPRGLEYAWRNTSATAQDVWFTVADTDDPGYRPSYGLSQPQDETLFTLNGTDPHHAVTTLRIRPVGRPCAAATLDMFATTSGVPNVCRVSAQAVLSG